ncbi:MAG: dihydropteroate synthase [Planctomycetaceae bacterium]|nr:dihydropteroate synthase [Planctomycetaceae bacterium]
MGIVNVTPDSFSDGGNFIATAAAVEHALRLADEGAGILDVGGESTRPGALPVECEEELRRVVPVIEGVCRHTTVPVSIDTSKAVVAEAALAAGAEIINDVTGVAGDARMLAVAASSGAGVCAMHMRGTPQTMQQDPTYSDVVAEIYDYLRARRDVLRKAGIESSRICLDPGIGFGKTHQHNLDLLTCCYRFHGLGCPLLVGHSRKGFIAKVIADKASDRMPGTIGVALSLAQQRVQVLRVHDVGAVHQALLLFQATGGVDGAASFPDTSRLS